MLPTLLDEACAQIFVFYWNGSLHKGLRAGNKLYKFVNVFPRVERDQAFELGCRLCDQGLETFITVSHEGYRVWVDLQRGLVCPEETRSETRRDCAPANSPKVTAEVG